MIGKHSYTAISKNKLFERAVTDLIYYTLKPVDKTMLIPVLPVSPETGFDYGEIESPSRSALFSIFGFVLLGLIKSVVIGFLVGKKCVHTKCCISRHFLRAWCSYKYRSGKPRQCQWRNLCHYRRTANARAAHDHYLELSDESTLGPLSHDSAKESLISISSTEKTSSLGDFEQSSEALSVDAKHDSECNCALPPFIKEQSSVPQVIGKSPRSTLLNMARMQDWPSVLRRVKHHPKEARKHDVDGLFPLHWACSGDPTHEVVVALLNAYPQGALEVDMEGSTALHFLTYYGVKDPRILEEMLRYNPDCAKARDVRGRTPLYIACESCEAKLSTDVFRVLLMHSAEVITLSRGKGDITPLSLAWTQALREVKTKKRRIKLGQKFSEENQLSFGSLKEDVHDLKPHSGRSWNNAMMLLHVAHTGLLPKPSVSQTRDETFIQENESQNRFKFLFASIAVKETPIEVFDEALDCFPEQIRTVDEFGDSPLVVALAASIESDGHRSRMRYVVRSLLQVHPQAAFIPSGDGQLPLFVGLDHGKLWEDGVKDVLKLNYEALWVKDSKTNMYAFMLAACLGTQTNERCRGSKLGNSSGPTKSFNQFNFEFEEAEIGWALQNDKEKDLKSLCQNGYEDTPGCAANCSIPSKDSELHHLTTIYELLRACPECIRLK